MSAAFTLVLDMQAPASPALRISDGAATTGDQVVWVSLETSDFGAGANDVSQMKVWGDVDPDADPDVQGAEGDSAWVSYGVVEAVRLSAGAGSKTLYARLRDDVGNQTLAFSSAITFDPDTPVVEVVVPISRGRVSKVAPYDAATFTWRANQPVALYQVRVVSEPSAPHQAGVLLGTAHGSEHTSGADLDAEEQVTTIVTGADLEAASPGNTTKHLKVFVQSPSGTWSA